MLLEHDVQNDARAARRQSVNIGRMVRVYVVDRGTEENVASWPGFDDQWVFDAGTPVKPPAEKKQRSEGEGPPCRFQGSLVFSEVDHGIVVVESDEMVYLGRLMTEPDSGVVGDGPSACVWFVDIDQDGVAGVEVAIYIP